MTTGNTTPKNNVLLSNGKVLAAAIVSKGKDLQKILDGLREVHTDSAMSVIDNIATALCGLELMKMHGTEHPDHKSTVSNTIEVLNLAMDTLKKNSLLANQAKN